MAVKHGTDGMNVHAPRWKNELSWNSVGIIGGFLATIATGGYMVAQIHDDIDVNTQSISNIRAEVRRIENETRRFEALEFRVGAVERQASSAADSQRTVEQAVVTLSSDMRLVMEILERLERTLNGGRSHHESPSPFRGTEP